MLGICSDPHANLPALEAILKDMRAKGVADSGKYCLGDIVGYHADPNKTVNLLINEHFKCLKGNHDKYALDFYYAKADARAELKRHYLETVNQPALEAIEWTAGQLTLKSAEFLSKLPLIKSTEADDYHIIFTHASPHSLPENWAYMMHGVDDTNRRTFAREAFSQMREKTLHIFGHEHVPFLIGADDDLAYTHLLQEGSAGTVLEPMLNDKVILNVGSAGQPRDDNLNVCWVSFDTKNNLLEFHRVAYDRAKTQRRVIKAGYDTTNAISSRLEFGK
jgi:predicted phosphodiesterase